jgi:hypothetical protein
VCHRSAPVGSSSLGHSYPWWIFLGDVGAHTTCRPQSIAHLEARQMCSWWQCQSNVASIRCATLETRWLVRGKSQRHNGIWSLWFRH